MSSSSSSSSSAEFSRPCPKNGLYDVFLSFRGEDTRYGFTASLYRSLRESEVHTFMDVNLAGEDIDYLFKIVAKSRMAVVIYSQKFASSDWCLNELEMILQRRKEKKMLMIPIFYKVDVHELKHLSGKTAKYLNKHIQEHGEATVKKWKDVIINLGKVSGISYQNNHGRNEYDFITDVIATIKEKLGEYEETLESGNMKTQIVEDSTSHQNIEVSPISQLQQEHRDSSPDTTAGAVGYRIVTTNYSQKQLRSIYRYSVGVASIDLHPTKPWVLLCWNIGAVTIWNHETQAEDKSFYVTSKVHTLSAKFISRMEWIVTGDMSGFVRVFDYNTSEKVKEFQASEKRINCVVVHPINPTILTASHDNLIKVWAWEYGWICCGTFAGHTQPVYQIAFNPKDQNSFASASKDGTIKIWNLHSPSEKFTIVKHAAILYSVEYFFGNDDKLYLLGNSNDKLAQVWDYESRTIVKTLEGHTRRILATLVHPKLPIIITASTDDTVRIWNKNTYQLELVSKFDFGSLYSAGLIESTNEIVLSCEKGMVLMKIVTDE